MPSKSWLGVIQGHGKWHRLRDHRPIMTSYQSAIVGIAVACVGWRYASYFCAKLSKTAISVCTYLWELNTQLILGIYQKWSV